MSSAAIFKLKHADEMTCLLYLEGELDRVPTQQASTHIQGCLACRAVLRALERESRLVRRAMLEDEDPLPTRLANFLTKGAVLGTRLI